MASISNDITVEQSKRIQIMRGIAISSVVFFHLLPLDDLFRVVVGPFMTFGVALFLFLSGLLTKSWGGGIRYKRILKVLPPYVAWTMLYTIANKEISLLAYNLVTAEACGILYYIFVYIKFVLLTPLIEKLATFRFRNVGFVIAPLSILLFKYIPFFLGVELNDVATVIWNDSCLPWFSFYYMGILLRNGWLKIGNVSTRSCIVLYIVSLTAQFSEGFAWMLYGSTNIASHLKLTSVFASMIVCLLVYKYIFENKANRITYNQKGFHYLEVVPSRIGDSSFGIYLCHIMVIRVVAKLIPFYNSIPYAVKGLLVLLLSWFFVELGKKLLGVHGKWIGLV